MALNNTASAGLSVEMKTFYDRVLLERTLPVLLHDKFAQKKTIPMHGGKTIEFRKFSALAVATTPLTEGVPPTLKDLTATAITATVAQYGDVVGFTDVVSTVTIDNILTETTALLGEQAGETIDELIRDVLAAGTTIYRSSTASASATRDTISAGDIFTVLELRKVVRTMVLNRAKKIDGFYQAFIHPRIAFDIQGTAEWVTANQYAQTGRQFDGSLGTLYGVKFWETDKAKVFAGEGEAAIDVYTMLVFGQNAYGSVALDGHSLKTIYKPLGSAGTADPLDQQQSMGWKVTLGTKILNDAFMLRYECAVSA
jgi:N4-gp56 family major capsid protein